MMKNSKFKFMVGIIVDDTMTEDNGAVLVYLPKDGSEYHVYRMRVQTAETFEEMKKKIYSEIDFILRPYQPKRTVVQCSDSELIISQSSTKKQTSETKPEIKPVVNDLYLNLNENKSN